MSGFDFMVLRRKRDLSQWELSKRADVPPYRISAFERGRVNLTPEEIARLKSALENEPRESRP